jgi:hypothetical protein
VLYCSSGFDYGDGFEGGFVDGLGLNFMVGLAAGDEIDGFGWWSLIGVSLQ